MNLTNGLLKFITCGSVDDGKSTLIGHILYDAKLLYADQEQALLLDSRIGSRGGAIDYSLLLDGLMAEREQGITIDVAYRYFTTDARSFIVADTPGHEEYTRNMAVGASFADLAVILVDASQGVLVQTRRHARICALMGIHHFVFAVNKMDLIGYDQAPFAQIAVDIQALKGELTLENVMIIPLSATEGDNVTRPSPHIPWYTGPTLLHYLETVDIAAAPEAGFYLPVQRVCRPDHTFRGFQGQIEAGMVRVGDQLTALPSREKAIVKSILVCDRSVETASAGQPVTIQLDREVDVSRGCVLAGNADLQVAKTFTASLLWMDEAALVPGQEYWVKIGTKLLPGVVTNIRYKVDVNSGEHQPAAVLAKNELALCDITLSQAEALAVFHQHKTLGELILIDWVSHATAACGVIEQIEASGDGDTVLEDGTQQVSIQLFDEFYYRPETHTVVRQSPAGAVYRVGDLLPLVGASYRYPADFDVEMGMGVAQIRGGRFAGFGRHGEDMPLLDERGLGISAGVLQAFDTYRTVAVRDELNNRGGKIDGGRL